MGRIKEYYHDEITKGQSAPDDRDITFDPCRCKNKDKRPVYNTSGVLVCKTCSLHCTDKS